MPKKIKIVLTLVAIVAVFSVYELAQYIHAAANGGPVSATASASYQDTLTCPTCDPDHDGLTNAEEVMWGTDPLNPDTDGDGFKDGEEVKSGHNPLVPGPNDLINADNLTQQFSDLAVAGMVEGSLQPDNTNYAQSLADITGSITDSAKYLFNEEVADSQIVVIETSAQADGVYLVSMAPFTQLFGHLLTDQYTNIESNLNTIGASGFTEDVKSYFADQASQYQDILNKGSGVPVPKNLKDAHIQFLSLALQMHDICDATANGDADPIKAMFAIKAFANVYQKYFDLSLMYTDALESINLDPNSVVIPKQ